MIQITTAATSRPYLTKKLRQFQPLDRSRVCFPPWSFCWPFFVFTEHSPLERPLEHLLLAVDLVSLEFLDDRSIFEDVDAIGDPDHLSEFG